jgi:colanic acid/amylovoran biosynthesis glycosyltransferase
MPEAIAYLDSRFPAISQTFVLNEILELNELGWDIELYPMIRGATVVSHPGVQSVMAHVHYLQVPSLRCFRAHGYWARTRPLALLRALALALTLPGRQLRFHLKSIWATIWAVTVAMDIQQKSIRPVHAHWATFPAHAAMVISRLTGCTFSFTAHAHDIYANAYGLDQKVSDAAFVATISELNRKILTETCRSDGRVEVVRCGVDLSQFAYRGPKAPNERFRIVAVGSLEEKKGQSFLIEACALLQSQARNVECHIIGEGPARTSLERLIREKELQDCVTLLGARTSVQVAAELSEADVFVMPSVVASNKMMEGIPVALMEAMAVGLPVVASSISGIPELVEDHVTGILVPERRPQAIAEAVSLVMDDVDLRASLGIAARQTISDRYNLRTNTIQLSHLFESVMHPGNETRTEH